VPGVAKEEARRTCKFLRHIIFFFASAVVAEVAACHGLLQPQSWASHVMMMRFAPDITVPRTRALAVIENTLR
jgi:ABC-type cobalamin transport system permease subunit